MNLLRFTPAFQDEVWPALGQAARDRLERYWSDLLRYNRAQNLISRRDPEGQLASMMEECLRAGRVLTARGLGGGRWADVGSGAGIPGLVLAAADPDQNLVLIERRQGRCDFLRREVAALELDRVQVLESDVRELVLEPFDVVLAKAVANPCEIEALCRDVVGGILVVFGRASDQVAAGWSLAWSEPLPGQDSVLRALAPC